MDKPLHSDLKDALQPRLRLFLSLDLVGSTAYKQGRSYFQSDKTTGKPVGWLQGFGVFYRTVEQQIRHEWNAVLESIRKCSHQSGLDTARLEEKPLEFWKAQGDELIYQTQIMQPNEVALSVYVWNKVIKAVRKEVQGISSDLDVKATAWLAGFPITNTEVVFIENDDILNDEERKAVAGISDNQIHLNLYYLTLFYKERKRNGFVRDFIGPSMDVGFRLAAHSTAREFVISVGVAHLLSEMDKVIADERNGRSFNFRSELKLYYAGNHSLKGVLGGKHYPVFWVCSANDDDNYVRAHDDLRGVSQADNSKVYQYCTAFFSEYEKYFHSPYIGSIEEGKIKTVYGLYPHKHKEHLDTINDSYAKGMDDVVRIEKTIDTVAVCVDGDVLDSPVSLELQQVDDSSIIPDFQSVLVDFVGGAKR